MGMRTRFRNAIPGNRPGSQRPLDFDATPNAMVPSPSGAMAGDRFKAVMSPEQRKLFDELPAEDQQLLRKQWELENPAPGAAGPPATQPGAAGPPATVDPNLPANKNPDELIPYDPGDSASAARNTGNQLGLKDIALGAGGAIVAGLGANALVDGMGQGYDYFFGDEGILGDLSEGLQGFTQKQPLGQGPEGLNQEGPEGPDISMDKQASMPFGGSGSPNMRDVNQAARIAKNTGTTVAEAYEQLTGYNLQTGARNPAIQPGEIMMSPMNDNMGGMNIGGDTGDGAQGPVRFRGGVTYDPNEESQRIGGSRRATPQIAAMTRQKMNDEQTKRENLLKYRNMLSPQTSMQGNGRARLNAQAMLMSGETPMGAIPEDMRKAMIYQAFPAYAESQAQSMQTLTEMAREAGFGTGAFMGNTPEMKATERNIAMTTNGLVTAEADRLLKSQVGQSNDWALGGQLWNSVFGGPDYELDETEMAADIEILMNLNPDLTEEQARAILQSRMTALRLGKTPAADATGPPRIYR